MADDDNKIGIPWYRYTPLKSSQGDLGVISPNFDLDPNRGRNRNKTKDKGKDKKQQRQRNRLPNDVSLPNDGSQPQSPAQPGDNSNPAGLPLFVPEPMSLPIPFNFPLPLPLPLPFPLPLPLPLPLPKQNPDGKPVPLPEQRPIPSPFPKAPPNPFPNQPGFTPGKPAKPAAPLPKKTPETKPTPRRKPRTPKPRQPAQKPKVPAAHDIINQVPDWNVIPSRNYTQEQTDWADDFVTNTILVARITGIQAKVLYQYMRDYDFENKSFADFYSDAQGEFGAVAGATLATMVAAKSLAQIWGKRVATSFAPIIKLDDKYMEEQFENKIY